MKSPSDQESSGEVQKGEVRFQLPLPGTMVMTVAKVRAAATHCKRLAQLSAKVSLSVYPSIKANRGEGAPHPPIIQQKSKIKETIQLNANVRQNHSLSLTNP